MVDNAMHGDDWPGWDEAWALVAFPLGIPVAVAAALGVGGPGAVVFVMWFVVGDRVPQ
jgi:hypothetical protein